MKRIASVLAAGLMAAGPVIAASLPTQAAPAASVTTKFTDLSGTEYCAFAYSVRALEPSTAYSLLIENASADRLWFNFVTNAKGSFKVGAPTAINRPAWNETNTITVEVYKTNSGLPPIEAKVKLSNRCPAQ